MPGPFAPDENCPSPNCPAGGRAIRARRLRPFVRSCAALAQAGSRLGGDGLCGHGGGLARALPRGASRKRQPSARVFRTLVRAVRSQRRRRERRAVHRLLRTGTACQPLPARRFPNARLWRAGRSGECRSGRVPAATCAANISRARWKEAGSSPMPPAPRSTPKALPKARVLFYADDPVAVFFLHIQGSGRVRFRRWKPGARESMRRRTGNSTPPSARR